MRSDDDQDVWSKIFNPREEKIDKLNRDREIVRYSQIRTYFLTIWKTMVIGKGRKKRRCFGCRARWLATLRSLEDWCEDHSNLTQSDWRYFLWGNSALNNAGSRISRLKKKVF